VQVAELTAGRELGAEAGSRRSQASRELELLVQVAELTAGRELGAEAGSRRSQASRELELLVQVAASAEPGAGGVSVQVSRPHWWGAGVLTAVAGAGPVLV
jgi:hypothetical protein